MLSNIKKVNKQAKNKKAVEMSGSFVIDFSENTQRPNQVLFWKLLLLFIGNLKRANFKANDGYKKTKNAKFPEK